MKQIIESLKEISYAVFLTFLAYLHSFLCDLKDDLSRDVFGCDDE